MIPKKLHFTFKSSNLPPEYQDNLRIWRKYCHDWDIYFYSDEHILSFFEIHFPQYLDDVKKIKGAVLADVFRYGVIYIFGGVYSYIDTVPVKPIPDDWLLKECVMGYEYQPSKFECWDHKFFKKDTLCQWTFLAKPKHPLLKDALDKSIQNLREKNYKLTSIVDVLRATGPILFTEVAEKYFDNPNTHLLDIQIFSPKNLKSKDLSKCIVYHQFHGKIGWKVDFKIKEKLSHLNWNQN